MGANTWLRASCNRLSTSEIEHMTALDRTAGLLRRNQGRWISILTIARASGLFSTTQRLSECRLRLGMNIENRIRYVRGKKISEYRCVN